MNLFGGVIQINGITYLLLVVFVVILGGYLLGKITIKGTSLSTAGVFIAAIIFGAFFSTDILPVWRGYYDYAYGSRLFSGKKVDEASGVVLSWRHYRRHDIHPGAWYADQDDGK